MSQQLQAIEKRAGETDGGRRLTRDETNLQNQEWYTKFASNDVSLQKEAQGELEDYIRYRVYEESFMDHIMTPHDLAPTEIDRMPDHDLPVKVIDLEPESPAAQSVPTDTFPSKTYMRGNRALCPIDRIVGPTHHADVMRLSTWEMDLRQVLSDQAVKSISFEKDTRLIQTVHSIVGAAAGGTVFTSGIAQFVDFGGMSRDTVWEQMKIIPATPSDLKTEKLLFNQITAFEVPKFDRVEYGGDMAQDMMRTGFTETRWLQSEVLVTIKKSIVPRGYFYHWVSEDFLGRHYVYNPTTLVVKREGFKVEYWPYHEHGAIIGNVNGVAIGQYDA